MDELYDRNKNFEFQDETEVEEFVRNILKEYKYDGGSEQQDYNQVDGSRQQDYNQVDGSRQQDYWKTDEKNNVESLLFSVIYYLLAVNDNTTLNDVIKLIGFSTNTIKGTETKGAYAEFIKVMRDKVPNHPSVRYYDEVKNLTINELLSAFETLLQILNEKSK